MKTDAEVFGGGGILSDADVFGSASTEDSFKTKVKLVGQDLRTRAGDVLQLPGAIGDMILGAPANLVGRIKGAGAAVNEWIQGGSRSEVEAADTQARNLGLLESFKTPFQSAVKSLTGAEHYDQEIVSQALEKGAKAVADKTGGVLTAHGVEMLLGTTLDALGIKGISPAVRAARARAIESQAKRELARRPPPEGQMSDADVFTDTEIAPGVAEAIGKNKKAQRGFTQQIEAGVKELMPSDLDVLFRSARDPAASVDALFMRARQNRGGKEAPPAVDSSIGTDVGTTQKTRLAEAKIIGEAINKGLDPTLDSALTKVSAGQRWNLTVEERIALQGVAQKAGIVDAKGKTIHSRQGGKITPEYVAALAVLGIGGAGLAYMFKEQPEVMKEFGWRLHEMFNTEAWKEEENKREWEKFNNPKLGPDDTTGLAMGPEDLLGPLGVGMAVKGKGGMWHPEAVTRLARPLSENLTGMRNTMPEVSVLEELAAADNIKPEAKAAIPLMKWSDKALRNYLNKHAGTKGDPLKDVEIPFGDGVKKWGELTDEAMTDLGKDHPQRIDYPDLQHKPGESVWGLQQGAMPGATARKAIESYLSHAGDFARQNISPEKLAQYDLVRLIKETAANDARVAKEMAKAQGESTAQLSVYKDYGDGMKWVELRLPEKLTEEQAKGVRAITEAEQKQLSPDFANNYEYTAIDSKGKPIENNYTQEQSYGKTPEEAYLAGELAKEGNTCGHCVGAYTESVASGESKIYSLRDAKGKSHVTVETTPPNHGLSGAKNVYGDYQGKLLWDEFKAGKADRMNVDMHETFAEWITRAYPDLAKNRDIYSPDILQIKGKQNRAPAEKYLPYVQDFVRQGPDGTPAKWGEVGDLEGTGLVLESQARALAESSLHDKLIRDERGNPLPGEGAKFNLTRAKLDDLARKQKYWAQDEISKLEKDATQAYQDSISPLHNNVQRGSADPKLLAGIAVVGGLAAYFSQNPEDADALAAAGILAATGKSLKSGAATFAKGLDYAFGALSTRLGEISPALRLRARDYERLVLERTEKALTDATPFLKILKKTPEGSPLDMALLNGDKAGIEAALPAADRPAWKAVNKILGEFEQAHKQLGRFKEGISSYFPRIVTDLEGLKNALNQTQRTSLEEALLKAEAKMIKEQQRGLTDVETSLIVNHSLNARPSGSQLPSYAKARGVEEVTPELRPFYAAPVNSLLRYASAAIQDLEMAKFFGKDLASKKIGGKVATDVDASIGNIVVKELKAGTMTHAQANDLRALLKARFEGGEKTPANAVQDLRNATNITLLGQFGSAATQIGDSMMTVYHHGLMPTLRAVKDKLTGDSQVSTKDFGVVNHIAEELGSNRWTGRALQAIFKASGFSAIDQFAKGLNLNAGVLKNQALAQTQKGRAELAQKWGKAFGDEFPTLVEDLANKQITDRVKSLAFSELSDAQPLTKSEMPQAYLEHPNGRILYQMKTYMLKQMDVIRRDAYNEIRDGNWTRGAKNLVAVASAMALSNIPGDVIKNWLSGRDHGLDKIDYVESLLRNFGVSRYTLDQIGSGKPLEVARDMMLPPYKHYQEMFNAMLPGAEDKAEAKSAKYIPLVGRALYDRELGGNEARKRAEGIRERLKLRDERESSDPTLKTRRLERKIRRDAKMREAQ